MHGEGYSDRSLSWNPEGFLEEGPVREERGTAARGGGAARGSPGNSLGGTPEGVQLALLLLLCPGQTTSLGDPSSSRGGISLVSPCPSANLAPPSLMRTLHSLGPGRKGDVWPLQADRY